MAPEQASGKSVDKRADTWSFGAVLDEMLAGRKAFEGESVSDTLATVMKVEPDWSALPLDVAASVQKLVRRCLTKDRKQRLQAIGDERIVLENPGGTEVRAQAESQPRPKIPWVIAIALTALLAVGLTLVIVSKIAAGSVGGRHAIFICTSERSGFHESRTAPDCHIPG